MTPHDLVILGAGPAGMAAAITAAKYGIRPVVIDEQPTPGGQIYRSVESTPILDPKVLGEDYWDGKSLVEALRDGTIDYRPGTSVWQLTPQRKIGSLQGDSVSMLHARYVILATGAMERPFPIPGWTLPGVMTAGSAQILLKSSGVIPESPVVLAGSGPLLLLLAVQYLRAGVPIAALLETTSRGQYRQALPWLPKALRNLATLTKGLGLINELRQSGVRHVRNVSALHAEGDSSLNRVSWQCEGSREWQQLETSNLLLHQGVVPNTQMTRALGCHHNWDSRQLAWHPRRDDWLVTDIENIAVAGDSGGIIGAAASALEGRLAGLGAAIALGNINNSDASIRSEEKKVRRQLDKETSVRPFLDILYRPAAKWRLPINDTIVCRCEEVRAGEIREIAAMGCQGPNQAKSFTRCGMGPCQGRMCGLTVSEILSDANQQSMEETGYYRLRPPLKPITLGQLAKASENKK